MGKYEHILSQRSDAAKNAAIPETASCWICLEGNDDTNSEPLVRGCACRGGAGYCHIECIASYAENKENDDFERGGGEGYCPWLACATCCQPFTGKFNADLARVHYEKYKRLDPKRDAIQFQKVRGALGHIGGSYMDQDRIERALEFCQRKYDIELGNIYEEAEGTHFRWFGWLDFADTCNLLGGCYLKMGQLDDAMLIFKKGLEYTTSDKKSSHYSDGAAHAESYLLNNIAEVHVKRHEFAEAVELRRKVLSIRERTNGKNSYPYCEACFSLGCVLVLEGEFHAGVSLVKESKEIATQILGPLHEHVMKCDSFLTQMRMMERLENVVPGSMCQLAVLVCIVAIVASIYFDNGEEITW